MTAIDIPPTVQVEFNHLILGEKLGSGAFRDVYVFKSDPNLVVKFENRGQTFSNVHEWQVWEAVQEYPRLAKWFAPCVAISFSGSVLIQVRTKPIEESGLYPKRAPNLLEDAHNANWGLLDGRPVVHDYGFSHALMKGIENWKLISWPPKRST